MADIFADIGKTALLPIQLAGEGLRGIHKGLAPGFHERRQLLEDLRKIQAAGGTGTEAGRMMLSEMSGKYKPDMFVSPLEKARTKYWSEGRAGTATSDLYEELEYWQKQLKGTVDPEGYGVRKDPKTGEVKGVLNQELYDTAQENISRIIKQLGQQRVSLRGTGRSAFGRMALPPGLGEGAAVAPTGEGEIDVYEQLMEEPTRRSAGLPARGGWAGALAGEDLSAYPRLQSIAESRNQFKEWQPASATDYKPTSLTQGSLMSKIARIKDSSGVVMGSRRAGEIVRQYPTVSNYLVTLKPSEVKEILGAIEDGMSESEILQYFGNE